MLGFQRKCPLSPLGQPRTDCTPILIARSWGASRRKPRKRTLGSAVYAIGGQADGAGRRAGRPSLAKAQPDISPCHRRALKRVIVVARERLAMQSTLAEALAAGDWYGFGRAMRELNKVLGE